VSTEAVVDMGAAARRVLTATFKGQVELLVEDGCVTAEFAPTLLKMLVEMGVKGAETAAAEVQSGIRDFVEKAAKKIEAACQCDDTLVAECEHRRAAAIARSVLDD